MPLLRVPLWRNSQARSTVGDVEVLSMPTNISMAVLFVVPVEGCRGCRHMKVTSSERSSE